MNDVLSFLQAIKEIKPNIKILDSVTTEKSFLYSLAIKKGFIAKKRRFFLDNIQNEEEILKQLDKALEYALQKEGNHSIAIGHPHKETFAALKAWVSYKNKNVEIVHLFSD